MPEQESMNDVVLPPQFESIAYIIYGEDYKAKLENLVSKVPRDFLDNDEWWSELKSVTKVNNQVINSLRNQYKKLQKDKAKETGKAFQKLNDTPAFKSDPQLQMLINRLSQQIATNDQNINNLLDLQKKIQTRLAQVDELIRSKEEKLRKTTNESVDQSGTIISESILSKLITRVRQYLVSDAFKNLIGVEEDGSKINQTTARLIIRDILQIVAKKAYEKLESKGISKKDLNQAFKTRTDASSQEIIKKAVKLLRKQEKVPEEPPVVAKPVQAPPVQPPPVKPGEKPPVQYLPGVAPPVQNKPAPSAVELLQKQMIKAGLAAKAQGINPIQAAENKLAEFEEQGAEDVAIVRRNWDRHKEKLKATRP